MILITGATGLNGKAIVREFARQKHEVRALVRDPDRVSVAGLGGLAGVELVGGDMRRADTLGAGLRIFDQGGFGKLRLLGSKAYACGMVVNRYAPAR